MIKTSVYINTDKLVKVMEYSAANGLTYNEVITLLLKKMQADGGCNIRKFSAVKYQNDDPDKNWVTKTVYFEEICYEFFTDMRKFFKISVSFLLAKAIDLFLETILMEENQRNYADHDWDITRKEDDFSEIWTIFWKKMLKTQKNE